MADTLKPCPLRSAPIEDVVTPLPKELQTPPDTTTYFVPWSTGGRKSADCGDDGVCRAAGGSSASKSSKPGGGGDIGGHCEAMDASERRAFKARPTSCSPGAASVSPSSRLRRTALLSSCAIDIAAAKPLA